MRKHLSTLLLCMAAVLTASAQGVVHSRPGDSTSSADGAVTITSVTKKQHFDWHDTATLDTDINSPKSVNIHPDGRKFYVNSLEGCATVVYDAHSLYTKYHEPLERDCTDEEFMALFEQYGWAERNASGRWRLSPKFGGISGQIAKSYQKARLSLSEDEARYASAMQ